MKLNTAPTLRPATFADAATLARLHADNWQRSYAGQLQYEWLQQQVHTDRLQCWQQRMQEASPLHQTWLLEASGQYVGFACFFPRHDAELGHYLDNLHVQPAWRGFGLGRHLMQHVAATCRAIDPALGLYLWTTEQNQSAQRFYESTGAQRKGQSLWDAPDGSKIPCRGYHWTAEQLADRKTFMHNA